MTIPTRVLLAVALAVVATLPRRAADRPSVLRIDGACGAAPRLVLRDQGAMEEEFARDGVRVERVPSLSSDSALELLNGDTIGFGPLARAALLGARSVPPSSPRVLKEGGVIPAEIDFAVAADALIEADHHSRVVTPDEGLR